MSHLFDSDFCVEHLRSRLSAAWIVRLATISKEEAHLSTVTMAELFYGATKGNKRGATLVRVHKLCDEFTLISLDLNAAEIYGQIRTQLERAGTPIGPNDLFIAAIAVANNLTLVTSNLVEFSRVPNLQILDWRTP